ncbi:hypothetical protein Q7P37_010812 [Cladosporium fusiforme]
MTDSNYLKNIAIVGAGGNSGSFMAQSLIDTGRFNVTAITRPDSTSELPAGIKVARASNDDHGALVSALRGQDALLITLSVTAPAETHTKIVRAAADAGVPWVLPNDWGLDTELEDNVRDIPGTGKVPMARKDVAETGISKFISVSTGFWYEWSLSIPFSYGFDFANKKVTFFDNGQTKISTSTWPQVGRAVTALLSLPIKPEGGNAERCLEHFQNKVVYVNSFTISQQDMFDSIIRVTGDKPEDWTVNKEPAKERYASAVEALQGGEKMAYVRMMYTRVFFDDGSGDFETRRGTANKILQLPEESLDDATLRAIERSETAILAYEKVVKARAGEKTLHSKHIDFGSTHHSTIATMADKDDTRLVQDSPRMRDAQTSLTFLQMALGLKQNMDDTREQSSYVYRIQLQPTKFRYGDTLEKLAADKPTGFPRCGDAVIISLQLKVALVTVEPSPGKTESRIDENVSEEHQVQWRDLGWSQRMDSLTRGDIRRNLARVFEPLCFDENDSWVELDDRDFLNNPKHKVCEPRQGIILLLEDKDKALVALEDEFDFKPYEHPFIINILDVRELNSAFLVRSDYRSRPPWSGSQEQRTQLSQSDEPLTMQQIWTTRDCKPPQSARGIVFGETFSSLMASASMAVDDSCYPGWLRSREQIDGGSFDPWRKLTTWQEKKSYLFEFEVAMKSQLTELQISDFMEASQAVISNPEAVDNALAVHRAKLYNFEDLIPERLAAKVLKTSAKGAVKLPTKKTDPTASSTQLEAPSRGSTVSAPAPTTAPSKMPETSSAANACTAPAPLAASTKERETEPTSESCTAPALAAALSKRPETPPSKDLGTTSAPTMCDQNQTVELTSSRTTIAPSNTTSAIPAPTPLQKGAKLTWDLERRVRMYKKATSRFLCILIRSLEKFSETLSEEEKPDIRGRYKWEKDYYDELDVVISPFNLKILSQETKNVKMPIYSWHIKELDTAISGRKELREWFDRLPADDGRHRFDKDHQAFLDTLIEVRNILTGK